jgi:fructokinase
MSFRIIGLGEVLWDLFPTGAQMGGAPANFAYHARALGACSAVVTRVGLDALGRDIRLRLEELGLPSDLVQVDEAHPTGTVTVELEGDGIPLFTIHERVAWDYLRPTDAAMQAAGEADAICFGCLAQRCEPSRSTIHRLLEQAPAGARRIFDINLRQRFYSRVIIENSLRQANVLKLNDTELPIVARLLGLGGDMESQVATLARQYDLDVVALTCGPQGSLLYQAGGWSECGSRPVRVQDTVGAGDAFTAALALGLLLKMDLDTINQAANEVARHVCACVGATPPLPAELRALFVQPAAEISTPAGKFTAVPDTSATTVK